MSEVFLRQLGIPEPDVHLGVGSGTHAFQTARVLEGFETYLLGLQERPAGDIVVGDVNSTLACALVAAKLNIPVAHIEAGLRSFDRSMPEEVNRIMTDAISDLLFVSEPSGVANLQSEGVAPSKINFAGNVMIDTLVCELPKAKRTNIHGVLQIESGRYAVATIHRPCNVDSVEKLGPLAEFILSTSKRLTVVFPVHPRTRARLEDANLMCRVQKCNGVRLLEPLGYHENLALLSAAKLVLTDSGGIQEETSYMRVPCLTLRPNTERPVTVTHGTNTVVGDDLERATALVTDILQGCYKSGSEIPMWDGRASERIASAVVAAWV